MMAVVDVVASPHPARDPEDPFSGYQNNLKKSLGHPGNSFTFLLRPLRLYSQSMQIASKVSTCTIVES